MGEESPKSVQVHTRGGGIQGSEYVRGLTIFLF